jgi:AcrR family transcriptional regulator
MSLPELNDRTTAIVEAACRVVAREGTHGLRMEAVAREADVSKALVHYYFATRRDLLRAAFAFVDARWRARVADELALLSTGADRLERFLLLYVDDELVPREHRAVWDEVWSAMRLDAELAPEVAAAYTRWANWIVELVDDGRADGSLRRELPTAETAQRLLAVADGMDSLRFLGVVTRERAQELLRRTVAFERPRESTGGAAQ